MNAIGEKGGGTFQGIKLLLCENPLPPLEGYFCPSPRKGKNKKKIK